MVRYFLCSRGTPIGETDLGFRGSIEGTRSGWFLPNPQGERVIPLIASAVALRARFFNADTPPDDREAINEALGGTSLLADLAESAHHERMLELDLRREDGSIVPTEDIGVQDMEQLIRLARLPEFNPPPCGDATGEEWSPLELMEEMELEPDFEEFDDDFACDIASEHGWTPLDLSPDDEVVLPPGERYQIHVVLADGTALP